MQILSITTNILSPLLAVDTVWLEAAPIEETASAVHGSGGMVDGVGGWGVLIAALFVLLACLLATRYLIHRSRTTDLQAAFSRLARRMMLPRRARKSILALSESSGIPAAAMLISRGAFTAALATADTDQTKEPRARAPRIMLGLFAELTPPPRSGGAWGTLINRFSTRT